MADAWPILSGSISFGLAFLAARALVRQACGLLARGGMTAENYCKDQIPTAVGIVVPLASLAPIALLGSGALASLWLLMLFGIAMLGFLDDAAGAGEHGGFSSHLRAIWDGRLTTGAVKALFGGGLALYAGWTLHGSAWPALLAGGVIALSTNAVNLLDLRPGRAIKGALALTAVGAAALVAVGSPFAWAGETVRHALAALGAGAALLKGDLGARYMIGDTGANTLGMGAGLFLVSLPYPLQGAVLILLVILHVVSERRSLSALIAETPVLKWLDDLGRE